ncbi:GDP-Man:Man(3)GlcNAc(2)-PP-Dol alpha-1,2-mannosyltransferase [Thelohanellus kitauei]|uniref:GDP-Man:Man(3)GlcNAc(2)-PP-Dol alpha-1,2-mannosyltransferase n=1 Tax=Thelohanellus kitauei TaxID=669202 RepID=A0A0C2N1F3_THEKT|nr:GDP-Man:Man(3)GlcNAc(2)-PP-Dol alpha-1,2-mannosyltransferase [Thelohanellus kitauei]
MVAQIQKEVKNAKLQIFTCDKTTPALIIKKANDRFGINLSLDIEFIVLEGKEWILPQTWKHFTLFGQSFGSIVLGFRASRFSIPDILIDTTGFVFFGVVMKLMGSSRVGAYVHYPTISIDMITRVKTGQPMYNNAKLITHSKLLTTLKILYYKIFATWYRFGGLFVDFTAVNSRWTNAHIRSLWGKNDENSMIIYPPCSPHNFSPGSGQVMAVTDRQPAILSISQFRPEKEHKKQVDIMEKLLQNLSDHSKSQRFKLILAGSIRSDEDLKYLESIQKYTTKKGLSDVVDFKINLDFKDLKQLYSKSLIGLHTMNQEHFGIGIVEMMAAGLVMVAHRSGGPESDIVVDFEDKPVGFLAATTDEYVDVISRVFRMEDKELTMLRENAIRSVLQRFSDKSFYDNIAIFIERLVL